VAADLGRSPLRCGSTWRAVPTNGSTAWCSGSTHTGRRSWRPAQEFARRVAGVLPATNEPDRGNCFADSAAFEALAHQGLGVSNVSWTIADEQQAGLPGLRPHTGVWGLLRFDTGFGDTATAAVERALVTPVARGGDVPDWSDRVLFWARGLPPDLRHAMPWGEVKA
jgi:hypothetical protein